MRHDAPCARNLTSQRHTVSRQAAVRCHVIVAAMMRTARAGSFSVRAHLAAPSSWCHDESAMNAPDTAVSDTFLPDDMWQLDPDHLDETRAALAAFETHSGSTPVLSIHCRNPGGDSQFDLLEGPDGKPCAGFGDLVGVTLNERPRVQRHCLALGRPGTVRVVEDPALDGVVVYANGVPAIAVAGRRVTRLPSGLLQLAASDVPSPVIAALLPEVASSLIGLDLKLGDPLEDHVDVGFLSLAPNLVALHVTDCANCAAIVDLSPLRALARLESLGLVNCASITDLAPLNGLARLKSLFLTDCYEVADLSPLSGLAHLEDLFLFACYGITDLSPLRDLENLKCLSVCVPQSITDLSPLRGLKSLEYLNLLDCPDITDLSPLRDLARLETLEFVDCPGIADLSPLRGLKNLEYLNLGICHGVTDLSPLRGLENLEHLRIGDCPAITDFSPIARLPKLELPDGGIEALKASAKSR
jgi:hypothetical protein